MVNPTDRDILDLFREPSTKEKGFTLLVKTYQEKLYAHVRRMVHSHTSADDVLQNIFIKVWRNLENFREDARLSTWLYRIAVNESLTFLEQEKRKKETALPEWEDEETLGQSAENDEPSARLEAKLEMAIRQLPEKQRTVFLLRYYQEMPYEEMSQILDTSVGALKASYHHAAKKIEAFFLNH